MSLQTINPKFHDHPTPTPLGYSCKHSPYKLYNEPHLYKHFSKREINYENEKITGSYGDNSYGFGRAKPGQRGYGTPMWSNIFVGFDSTRAMYTISGTV